jgi:hypothetical protein
MDSKIIGIHQPNFMPWLGYFYKIWKSDIFIFLDDVQFQKKGASYTNRVSININGESKYLTVPIKRESGTWNINKTKFLDNKWKKKIISSLQGSYAKANFFKENKEFIYSLIEYESDNLADFNMNFILKICNKLDINTNIVKSYDYNITTISTQRLIDLIKKLNGNIYLSGSGGDNYQEKELFKKENIKLNYNQVPNLKYSQIKTEEFIDGLSIVDAIFNIGFSELKQRLFSNSINI